MFMSYAASGMIFQTTGGLVFMVKITGSEHLKMVTERICTISSNFIEASRYYFGFSFQKDSKNSENHQRSLKKYVFDLSGIKTNINLVKLSP
jgi:hypothetical protein